VLAGYRVIFGILIIVASVQTLLATQPDGHAVMLLAGVEIAGALILMRRRTQWLGACLLLCVFAVAQVISAMAGEWPTRFLQYAASTLLIVALDRTLLAHTPG
jgi:NADH:ubiquinone oxidoreductase subunit 6 (subunit J)